MSVPTLVEPELVRLPTGDTGGHPRRLRIPRSAQRVAGVLLFFAAWEVAAQVGWVSPRVLAAPSTVFTAGIDLIRDGTLLEALWASTQRVLWGLAIGIPIATALALVAGLSRVGDALVDSNVQMLRFVPILALQPLLIVWLGIGESIKIALIALAVGFPVYVNTVAAIRSIDPGYLQLAKVVGLGRTQQIRRVVLPGALPGLLVGIRLASAIAWLVLFFAEQINAQSGIGYLMVRAQIFYQTDVLVVGLVTYAALGLIFDFTLRFVEAHLLRWQPGR